MGVARRQNANQSAQKGLREHEHHHHHEKEGVGGFVRSLSQGLVGAVARPVEGILGAVEHVAEGFRHHEHHHHHADVGTSGGFSEAELAIVNNESQSPCVAELPATGQQDVPDVDVRVSAHSDRREGFSGASKWTMLTRQMTLSAEKRFQSSGVTNDNPISFDGDFVHEAEGYLRDDVLQGGILTKGTRTEEFEEKDAETSSSKYDFTDSKWFTAIIGASILLNAIQMGVQTDYPQAKDLYMILEQVWTFIFAVEMFSKIFFHKLRYFYDSWNILDFFLVWLSILEEWILPLLQLEGGADLRQLSILRILRILRTLRFIRLLKIFKELWLIIKGMISSLKTIFWASLLLIIVLYVTAIFCCQMVGKSDEFHKSDGNVDYFPDWDAYQHYGTVPRAMFTLFEVCLEPLSLRPILEKQLYMAPFFLMYVFLTTFGVMNVIIGVIVENTSKASEEANKDWRELEKQEQVMKVGLIRDACRILDTDSDGFVLEEELKKGLCDPEVSACLKDLELPYGCDEAELFQLIDSGSHGKVTHARIMTNLSRSIMQNDMQHMFEIKGNMHHMRRNINVNSKKLNKVSQSMSTLEHELEDVAQRIDQVDLLSLELSKDMQDIVALAAGLPPKPQDFVSNVITTCREDRAAAIEFHNPHEIIDNGNSPFRYNGKSKIHEPHVYHILPLHEQHSSHRPAHMSDKIAMTKAMTHYEQGNDTPPSQDKNHVSQVLGHSDLSPHGPGSPQTRSSSKEQRSTCSSKEPEGDKFRVVPAISLPAMAAIPFASLDAAQDEDALSVDHHSESKLSATSRTSKISKVSKISKLSVPPALNILLNAAYFEGGSEGALGLDETDHLFDFFPEPKGAFLSHVHPPSRSHSPSTSPSEPTRPTPSKQFKLGTPQPPPQRVTYSDEWSKTEELLANIPDHAPPKSSHKSSHVYSPSSKPHPAHRPKNTVKL